MKSILETVASVTGSLKEAQTLIDELRGRGLIIVQSYPSGLPQPKAPDASTYLTKDEIVAQYLAYPAVRVDRDYPHPYLDYPHPRTGPSPAYGPEVRGSKPCGCDEGPGWEYNCGQHRTYHPAPWVGMEINDKPKYAEKMENFKGFVFV